MDVLLIEKRPYIAFSFQYLFSESISVEVITHIPILDFAADSDFAFSQSLSKSKSSSNVLHFSFWR